MSGGIKSEGVNMVSEQYDVPDGIYSESLDNRLEVLRDYVRENPKEFNNGFVNLHIHTNESFSVFTSPTEAVFHAYQQDVKYFGINDHYTIAGHPEFRAACDIAGLRACFSMEAISMDRDAAGQNFRYNDPDNPGRIYIVGKGVTSSLNMGSTGWRNLSSILKNVRRRNKKIAKKLREYASSRGVNVDYSFDDALALTPRGITTERHVVQAFCMKIQSMGKTLEKQRELFYKITDVEFTEEKLKDVGALLDTVRALLTKAGKPCYVEEDPGSFTTIENLVGIYRELGAIPTYPMVGFPITEAESDLEELVKSVKSKGMYAFDMIERIDENRAKEIIDVAKDCGFPVFIGTEHNTKKMIPLVGKIGKNRVFLDYFIKSAHMVLGHQLLTELCNFGYIDEKGRPRIQDLREGFELFAHAGAMELDKEKIEELKSKTLTERKKFFGI